MSWLSKWFTWLRPNDGEGTAPRSLAGEPQVFECRACGKVFDGAHRGLCPECESPDVERVG